jgi:hypothetical protein
MNNKIDWINGRIDIRKMGRKWTIVNWSFLGCGAILVVLNFVGSRVFNIPWVYIMYAGFAYMIAFTVYLLTVLIVFTRDKNIVLMDNGTVVAEEYQMNPYGHAIINETKHETTFIKPQLRWQYGVVYLGLAIWLSTVTFDLFKVLFLENRHPMSISESVMPMLALV